MTAERVSFLTRPGTNAEILVDLLAVIDEHAVLDTVGQTPRPWGRIWSDDEGALQ